MSSAQPGGVDDIAALHREIAELRAQLAAKQSAPAPEPPLGPAPTIHTGGGATFLAEVRAETGHVIGRDFIVNVVGQVLPSAVDQKEAVAVIAQYLDGLVAELKGLRLYNVDEDIDPNQNPLELRDIYVPLDTEEVIPAGLNLASWLPLNRKKQSLLRISAPLEAKLQPVSALDALAHYPKLTLLGRGGCGKSTFGAWVLLVLAQAWREQVTLEDTLGASWTHGRLLPIRVVLREFAADLRTGRVTANASGLWAHVAHRLGTRYCTEDRTLRYLQGIAREHGALFLLDGLDECGADRERVNAAVEDLARCWGGKSRFLRTARPSAWPQGTAPEQGVYTLAALDQEKIGAFIQTWYDAVARRGWPLKRPVDQMVGDLVQACRQRDIAALAGNPLLLTLMTIIHTTRARLPEDRAELYGCAVDLLLQRWDDADDRQGSRVLCETLKCRDFPLDNLKEVLAKVAFEVHADQAPYVGEDRLKRALRMLTDRSDDRAAQVIDYLEDRTGLLICDVPKGGDPDQERQFSFPHRTFQEYLAAFHLAKFCPEPAEKAKALARGDLTQWEVVLPLMARIAGAGHGSGWADALIGRRDVAGHRKRKKTEPDQKDWQCALLAGLQLQEIGRSKVEVSEDRQAILERVTDWLVEGLAVLPAAGGLPARHRAQAGDVLSRLGDPRFDPQRYFLPCSDDLGFVPIPGCDDLRFAQYPVTVAQFRAFIEHSGFEPGDPNCLRDPDHRPVRCVNHAEALAYCEWLTGTGCLPDGWRADLPEGREEWEFAARGGSSRQWTHWWQGPADPERANYDATGIRDTSVVGCFPANEYGLYDMLGNVWEWTKTTTTVQSNGETFAAQLVRGGSWAFASDHMNCAVYSAARPDVCDYNQGFRVVLRHCTNSNRGFPPARE